MNDALKIAFQELRDISFESIPKRCNVGLEEGKIKIRYLNRGYVVSHDDVTYPDRKTQVSDRDKTIILHYLILGKGTPPSGKLIDFREVPGGRVYYEVFEKRVYERFLGIFGESPTLFIEVATSLGGERINYGDIGFRFTVLPQIPIDFVFHRGDEEFPPACKVLFDASISDYLPTEDIAVICEEVVRQLSEGTTKGHENDHSCVG